jgi:hypothetical protein
MNSFEKTLLAEVITESPSAEILAEQLAKLTVKDREYTGVGSFTEFEVPDDVTKVTDKQAGSDRLLYGSVYISSPDLEHGGGCILYIENGVMDCLECYAYGDFWPRKELVDYEITRDYKKVEQGLLDNDRTASDRV